MRGSASDSAQLFHSVIKFLGGKFPLKMQPSASSPAFKLIHAFRKFSLCEHSSYQAVFALFLPNLEQVVAHFLQMPAYAIVCLLGSFRKPAFLPRDLLRVTQWPIECVSEMTDSELCTCFSTLLDGDFKSTASVCFALSCFC
jgi:hypothetical protein